jgi:membrane protein YdbS with pleckstrin-like domain
MEKEIDIDRRKIVFCWRMGDVFGLLVLAPFVVFLTWIIVVTLLDIQWWGTWQIFLLVMSLLGITLMLGLLVYVHGMHILPWYYRLQANALRYCLVDKALRVESGVIFKSRKTIPFDKITSLELVQGPFLRYLGMWIIKVQNASTGARTPEATLLGVLDPEQVREAFLTAKVD